VRGRPGSASAGLGEARRARLQAADAEVAGLLGGGGGGRGRLVGVQVVVAVANRTGAAGSEKNQRFGEGKRS
jgi:hypothetical protein